MHQINDTSPNAGTDATTAFVAIGSNLGGGGLTCQEIVKQAMVEFGPGALHSGLYRTPAFPPGSGPDFVNAVIGLPWTGSADALLERLHRAEADAGRERRRRWAARVLDLDLLALGNTVLPDRQEWAEWYDLPPEAQQQAAPDRLILPHPRLTERAFVLVPFHDIAPEWRHPVTGLSVAQMLAALPMEAVSEVKRL